MKFAEYGSLLTEAYDIDKPEAPQHELRWHSSFIEATGQPVLAAMCGSGRFLVPLVAGGIEVDGVDASSAMLAACRAKLEAHGLAASLAEQKLCDLELSRRYACAFIGGGGSFGLVVDPEKALESLRRLRAHLLRGAKLRFEAQTPAVGAFIRVGRPHVRSWVRPDGGRIVLTSTTVRFEDDVSESIGKYELFVGGRLVETELDDFPIRLHTVDGMVSLLQRAGFTDVVATKAYTDEPATEEDALVSYCAVA